MAKAHDTVQPSGKMRKYKDDDIVFEWLEPENLTLIEGWARDGYVMKDIAAEIGISVRVLYQWRKDFNAIDKALRNGKEVTDYKVENALLKSALGYRTKEVRVTTITRYGKVVETQKEVLDKEQPPNVSAIQCWLFNRLPDKWKKNRDGIFNIEDEDTSLQVTVTRAAFENKADRDEEVDEEWVDEVNKELKIRKSTDEEIKESKRAKNEKKRHEEEANKTKVELDEFDTDEWPDNWEELV